MLRCMVLLGHGASGTAASMRPHVEGPRSRVDLLRAAVALLDDARLVTCPRTGHGLLPVLEDALDHVARFVAGLRPATSPSR
jgi:hypothetical protein